MRRTLLACCLAVLAGCISCGEPAKPPVAAPSPYPIDFPLVQKWSWRGAGRIIGRPVADATRIYVTTEPGYCYGVNRADGTLAWVFKAVKPVPTPPLLAGDRLIFYSTDNEYYELNPATGETLYKEEKFGKPATPGALADDLLLYATADGQVRCYSTRTHKVQWKFAAGGKIVDRVVVADRHVYFGGLDGVVYCLRMDDGSKVWKCAVGGEIRGHPAVSRRLVIAGSTSNHLYAIDRTKGTLVWQVRMEADIIAAPAVMDIRGNERILVAGFDNYLYCLKTNGFWVHRTSIPARMYDELVGDEHMLIVASFATRMIAMDPKDGTSLGQFDLPSESRATPLLSNRTLYAVMFDSETGEGILAALVNQPPPPPQTQPAGQTQPATGAQTQPAAAQSQPAHR